MLKHLYNRFFPRFITEMTAFVWDEELNMYLPVCSVYDIRKGEVFDAVGLMKGFNLFGIMLFPSQVGKMTSWDEFREAVERAKDD